MFKASLIKQPIFVTAAVVITSAAAFSTFAQQATPPATQATTAPTTAKLNVTTLKESDGAAKDGDRLFVHFIGKLADGTEVASSYMRGEPVEITLGAADVLKAWDEGLVGMKVGEKRRLVVPPELGYGSRGQGSLIPPDAELVFDVELVGLQRIPDMDAPAGESADAPPTTAPAAE